MLHRAASNAYSWWWASHLRTKQSKWMEQNLLDFEEKVDGVMKLLEEDGDSFAMRANMYYKRRPELINFVEESFRAYRALGERYDHLSKELQNANNTIASIYPDKVPLMDEDDEVGSPKSPRKVPEGFKPSNAAPKVPKPPQKDLKAVITSAAKKYCSKKVVSKLAPKETIKSGLSKKDALEEIDKLQKQILTLQTVKEFLKSTYDNAIHKYWENEEEIKRLQERVSLLHDEFGEGMVIEDDVARRLMAEAALKTCQETLTRLQVKQDKSFDETRIENTRVTALREKLESLMHKLHYDQVNRPEQRARKNVKQVEKNLDEEVEKMNQQKQELQLLQDQLKEKLAAGSSVSISVSEMAEKIDGLVTKVISLETEVSSQDALVRRLRSETDELQSQIVTLEDDKASLIDEKNDLTTKLTEMDEKMQGIEDLNEMVDTQNTDLQTHFIEALCDLDHISDKLPNVKPDERDKIPNLSKTESEAVSENEVQTNSALNQENILMTDLDSDKSPKVSDLVGIYNKKIDATDFADNNMQKDMNDIGLGKDKETNVTGLMDNAVKTDNEMATVLLENEAKSDNKVKVTEAHMIDPISLTPNNDLVASSASSITTGDQDLSLHKESKEANSYSNSSTDRREKNAPQSSSETDNATEVHSQEQITAEADEPNWRQMFMDGMNDKEKLILNEYTNALRNYKVVKKSLTELKSSNALKDEEIRLLRQKLGLMDRSVEGNIERKEEEDNEDNDDLILKVHHQLDFTSAIEENLRRRIDEILEENLDFWLNFSTTFSEIQRFETTIDDLQSDVSKLEENAKSESTRHSMKSEARPIFKHLSEIQTELSIWLNKGASLREELKYRSSSLCDIQEEITKALKASAEDEFKFTSYQAAKFQGEILNMKQENNKVADELQAGLDHVSSLLFEVDRILSKMCEQYGFLHAKKQRIIENKSSDSRARSGYRSQLPLGAFIFGFKPKLPKHSIFSGIHPGTHRKDRAAIKGQHL